MEIMCRDYYYYYHYWTKGEGNLEICSQSGGETVVSVLSRRGKEKRRIERHEVALGSKRLEYGVEKERISDQEEEEEEEKCARP